MNRYIAIALLVTVSTLHAVLIKENRRAVKIRIATFSSEQTNGVAHFSSACSNMVDRLFMADATPDEYIDINEAELDSPLPQDSERKLFFNSRTEMHDFTFRLMRALVRRRVREYF